jgi:predicted ThiF/HesA family dinucleotide-utilizing enzyme
MNLAPDAQLAALLTERARLLEAYAHVLRRVGASHPERAKVNAKRATQRKHLQRAVRANAEAIAQRNMQLWALT